MRDAILIVLSATVDGTVTQEKGIPYRRHKPSAALRDFLDPLDPGSYFDCGGARLHGLDDALLREAESRGRTIGDDSFQLVATDMGLIFCRPSISFAIAARWDEVMLIRPRGEDPVVLPITWPTHGELKFTVSKRLASNIFRRWLQLRMQATRLARQEQADRFGADQLARSEHVPARTVPPASQSRSDDWEVVAKVEEPSGAEPARRLTVPRPDRRNGQDPARRQQQDRAGRARRRRQDRDPDPTDPGSRPDSPARNGQATAEPLGPEPALSAATGERAEPEPRHSEAARADRPTAPTRAGPAVDPVGVRETGSAVADQSPEPVVVEAGDDRRPPPLATIQRPRTTPPSWVGSPASLVTAVAVISTVVLVAAVAVGTYRRAGGGSAPDPAAPSALGVDAGRRTTIDHQRFNPSANRSDSIGSSVLTPSGSSGGQSQAGSAAGATASARASASRSEPSPVESPTVTGPLLCNSNYSGCVPDVSDVDCPNDGDGPVFSTEPAIVMGDDVYELDTDGDGETCEVDQPRRTDLSAATGRSMGSP